MRYDDLMGTILVGNLQVGCLVQECRRANALLSTVRASLEDLLLLYRGAIVQTYAPLVRHSPAALRVIADYLACGAVPPSWAARSWPSCRGAYAGARRAAGAGGIGELVGWLGLAPWLASLDARVAQLRRCAQLPPLHSSVPQSLFACCAYPCSLSSWVGVLDSVPLVAQRKRTAFNPTLR